MHTCIHAYMHTYLTTNTYIRTQTRVNVYLLVHVRMQVLVHVCIHIYIYMHVFSCYVYVNIDTRLYESRDPTYGLRVQEVPVGQSPEQQRSPDRPCFQFVMAEITSGRTCKSHPRNVKKVIARETYCFKTCLPKPRNYGNIVFMASCSVYIINSGTAGSRIQSHFDFKSLQRARQGIWPQCCGLPRQLLLCNSRWVWVLGPFGWVVEPS